MTDIEKVRLEKIQRKIFLLRRQGKTWEEIRDIINTKFETDYNSSKIQEYYDIYGTQAQVLANTMSDKNKAVVEANTQWTGEMKDLFEQIKTRALKHLETADKLLDSTADEGLEKKYFDRLPVLISLMRGILDQIKFLDDRLKKIEINQNKLVLNEMQIFQTVNKAFSQKEKETGYLIHPGTGKMISLDRKKKKKIEVENE